MKASPINREEQSGWPGVATGAARTAFALIWAIDAYLKWRPEFAAHLLGYLQNASHGQPLWLGPWFSFWINLVRPMPDVFAWLTRIIETAIAIGLLLGLARKWIYVLGAVYSLLLWATGEGFGGPYTAGASDIGPALIYVLVFITLIILDRIQGQTPYSLDYYLEQRKPGWKNIAEWGPTQTSTIVPSRLSLTAQAANILGIAITLVISLGTLQSALNVSAATPANAAAAVSPLSLASSQPITATRNATLPPLISTGDTVSLTITATDATIEIASGVSYQAWTFDGTVPGPILHVRQGQTVNVTFVNHGEMSHSIDFHAAQVLPDVAYRSINPGQSLSFSFVARTAGAFLYHCGTPPVLLHIGNGMYGAIIVDPDPPLPAAEASYVLVQGEWYTRQVNANLMTGDYNKMMAMAPDEVVFNGAASQYKDHPLQAKAGQRIRLYVVNAGPNLTSAFHVIGAIFSDVYPDGDPTHALTGVSTYGIAPGEGAVFDLVIPQSGSYPFVDHSMRDMMLGAVGVITVTP